MTKKKSGYAGIRLEPDVQELLQLAEEATGKSKTDLFLDALKEHLPTVVDNVVQQRLDAQKRFSAKVKSASGERKGK